MAYDETALIVVHMQMGFANDDPSMHDLADRIATWLRDHRSDVDVLVTSRFRNREGSTYHRLVGDDMFDDAEVALLPVVASLDADHADETHTYSAATPDVVDLLRARGVRRVLVVGVDTDQCVLATVLTLFDEGFEPIVLADLCHSTAGSTPHEAGLVALRRAVGEDRVLSSGHFVAQSPA